MQSATRSRESFLSRGGSSRIRRGVYQNPKERRVPRKSSVNKNAAEETRSAQARSRYVCPSVLCVKKKLYCHQTADVTFFFVKLTLQSLHFRFHLVFARWRCAVSLLATLVRPRRNCFQTFCFRIDVVCLTFGDCAVSLPTLCGDGSPIGWVDCCKLSLPFVPNVNPWYFTDPNCRPHFDLLEQSPLEISTVFGLLSAWGVL